MTSALPFEIVLLSVLVFVAVLLIARFHALFERSGSGVKNNEPLTNTSEPNRRNQSGTPPA
jgi:hypothetical protein